MRIRSPRNLKSPEATKLIVTTHKNQNVSVLSGVFCLLDSNGQVLYLRSDDTSGPGACNDNRHFSEVFSPVISDGIAWLFLSDRFSSSDRQSTVSRYIDNEPEDLEVSVTKIILPEPAQPVYHVLIRSSHADHSNAHLLKDLLDRSPNAVMSFMPVYDRSGTVTDLRFTFANRKACSIIGTDKDDLTGTRLLESAPGSLPAAQFEKMVNVLKSGSALEYELSAGRNNSNRSWLQVVIQNYSDGITLSIQDITAKKLEIQKTRKLNAKLRHSNIQKDKLFSIIAHDFRSPFAGCLGLLEMVLDDLDSFSNDDLRKMLEMIYNQSQSTYQLLESLLEWAMTQQNRINFSPERIDLHHIAGMTFFALNSNAEKKNIQLLNRIKKGTYVNADKNMLRTILKNLLSNGIKFTNQDGIIEVRAKVKNRFIEISVTDNGIGIQKNSQKRIFDIDYQYIGKGTDGEKGTGIGLHVCREFVGRHGGAIAVDSEPGKGSTFRFTLPGLKAV
jgi:signal transduction histidine kinase